MTNEEWSLIRTKGSDPEKILEMAETIFSFFFANGLTAREAGFVIHELKHVYKKRREQDKDMPLVDANKEYTARKDDVRIDQDSSENIFNYIVLQKIEDMQRNIGETKKVLETHQKQCSDEYYRKANTYPWMYGRKLSLFISITALVISVAMIVLGKGY